MTNSERANHAYRALSVNCGYSELRDDPESAVTDMLANLMHYCQEQAINFDDQLRKARNHFQVETAPCPQL